MILLVLIVVKADLKDLKMYGITHYTRFIIWVIQNHSYNKSCIVLIQT